MKVFLTAIGVLLSIALFAQEPIKCDHEQWLQQQESETPGYIQKIKDGFADFQKMDKQARSSNQMLTIAVHVILVHSPGESIGSGTNFSMEHVESQIDVLNEDFGHYNSDAGNTPPVFPADDTGIQFCLATVDEDGNPTDGITRYATTLPFASNASSIRQETRWDRDIYVNIWSAPNLPYLGLASVPSTSGLPSPNNDFIHVDAASFGGPGYGTFPNYDLGRTTTHEMGHYLGLDHVWGGGCGQDDGISDTPNQQSSNFGCPNHPSPSCNNGGDMFMNYMDYVNDNCMNAFTTGQGEYMNLILSTSRASLPGASVTACAFNVPLAVFISSQENPSCSDVFDGVIVVSASGGSQPYTFTLNNSTTNFDGIFTDLPGGSYTINISDDAGNFETLTVELFAPEPLIGDVVVEQENVCGSAIGIVEIDTDGGTPPYEYSLNSGPYQNSNTFEDLEDGFYAFNVVDANDCFFSDIFELSSGAALTLSLDTVATLPCYGDSTGFIEVTAEGGTGDVLYSLNNDTLFQSNGEFVELPGGEYQVFAIDSLGCSDSLTVEIAQPDSFYLDLIVTDVTCFGGNSGAISYVPNGGTEPYLYSLNGINFVTDTVMTGLAVGDYTLLTSDGNGCELETDFTIQGPDSILLITDTIVNVTCFGDTDGMFEVSASGGTGSFVYSIEGEENNTGSFSNLEAGSYTVYATDSLGCLDSLAVIVGVNSQITVMIEFTDPTCSDSNDGSIEVIVSNTMGDVTYSLNGGTPQSDPVFNNLGPGDYTITISDESGCQAAGFVSLTAPDALLVSVSDVFVVSCFGGDDGQVELNISGGIPPYSYEYIGGAVGPLGFEAGEYTVIVSDSNGCSDSADFIITQPDEITLDMSVLTNVDCSTGTGGALNVLAEGGNGDYLYTYTNGTDVQSNNNGMFSGLGAGNYNILVTDSKGCTNSFSGVMPFENDFMVDFVGVNDILCFGELGGGVDLEVSGGMGNITYSLNGTTIEDPKNLNIGPGDYVLEVADENGCVYSLNVTINEPAELVITEIAINEGDNTFSIIAEGGMPGYMYSIDNGATFQSSNTFDISQDQFDIVVIDMNGCTATDVLIIQNTKDIIELAAATAYPNPFNEVLTLNLDFNSSVEVSIEIFDLSGKLVHQIPNKLYNAGENIEKIDVGNFANSIYIVKIASAKGHRFIKLTKM